MNKEKLLKNFAATANEKFAESGLKKSKVAEFAGINPATLSRLLKQQSMPSFAVAVAIAKSLDFSIDELEC